MKLYEFNQLSYAGLPSLSSEKELKDARNYIKNYLKENPSIYYLMLNNDKRYYTLYTFVDGYKFDEMAKEILEIALELGEIKSIEKNENTGVLEFWIMYEEECHMFVLFDYSRGVVEV